MKALMYVVTGKSKIASAVRPQFIFVGVICLA